MHPAQKPDAHAENAAFLTTAWTLVRHASDHESDQAERALQALCKAYWYPVYTFARTQGKNATEASDITQEFFYRLIKDRRMGTVDRKRGRFRTFLIHALKNFMVDQYRYDSRLKRGGGEPLLDLEEAEKLYQLETNQSGSPERLFDRKWAHALLNQVLNSLRAEYRAAGRADRFEVLKLALIDRDDAAYQDLASRLGLSDSGFRAALFRFRRRYRELFRSAVTALVDDPEKVDEEVHYIISLLQER